MARQTLLRNRPQLTLKSPIRIDVHIHLAGTGCGSSGCWISPRFRHRYTFRALQWLLKISEHNLNTSIDGDWVDMIVNYIRTSQLDYGVLLGFDGVYHQSHGDLIEDKSQMIIPDDWVFQCCMKHSNLLPGPSINPHSKLAIKRLEKAIENQAVLIKWLPSAQGIDPSNSRHREFYLLLAASQIPLLVHIGGERTFAEVAPQYNDFQYLKLPLELGVKVICAHSGTPVLFGGERDQIPDIQQGIARYPHLYLDNSGLLNPGRFHSVSRLLNADDIQQRTVYGSDWPVPSNSFYFLPSLGLKKVRQLEKIKNPVERDIQIKRCLGFHPDTETRATKVLANLDYWMGPRASIR